MADEQLGQLRRDQYCIFVPGQAPLTNAEAAQGIIDEAKVLLQRDLQAMGFGVVVQQSKPVESKGRFGTRGKSFVDLIPGSADEAISNSDTDSEGDVESDEDLSSARFSSTLQFPSLLDDKNIHVRNAYVDGKRICSEFILMIEHKETMAISCVTTRSRQAMPGADANAFHINDREELHLQYVACAFSVHKVYVINVAEDEQCNFDA